MINKVQKSFFLFFLLIASVRCRRGNKMIITDVNGLSPQGSSQEQTVLPAVFPMPYPIPFPIIQHHPIFIEKQSHPFYMDDYSSSYDHWGLPTDQYESYEEQEEIQPTYSQPTFNRRWYNTYHDK